MPDRSMQTPPRKAATRLPKTFRYRKELPAYRDGRRRRRPPPLPRCSGRRRRRRADRPDGRIHPCRDAREPPPRTQPLTKKIAQFGNQGGIGGSAGMNGFCGHCDFLGLSFCRSLAARRTERHAGSTAKSFEVICFYGSVKDHVGSAGPPCDEPGKAGSGEQNDQEAQRLQRHHERHIDVGGSGDDRHRVSAAGAGGEIGRQRIDPGRPCQTQRNRRRSRSARRSKPRRGAAPAGHGQGSGG